MYLNFIIFNIIIIISIILSIKIDYFFNIKKGSYFNIVLNN